MMKGVPEDDEGLDIIKIMKENGWDAKVVTKMFPIWTTDWLTDEAREKLRVYGITPPEKGADEHHIGKPKKCPRCGSMNSIQISRMYPSTPAQEK